jgi:biopolymer transport protein TolR
MSFKLNQRRGPISEINVTPLVDVMLVLLVIFMISAPLMFSGVDLNLPKTKKVSSLKLTEDQVILSLNRAGEFFIGKDKFLKDEVLEAVKAKMLESKTQRVFLRADYGLDYGNVARVISNLKRSGISEISLVTEIEKND